VAWGEWREWSFLRAPLERQLARSLDRPVLLAPPFGLRVIGSVRVHAGQVSIGPVRPGRSSPADPVADAALLEARDARLVVPYSTLWRLAWGRDRDSPYVESLDVERLELNLARDAQGRANWRSPDAPDAPDAATAQPPPLPRFGTLRVADGHLRLHDVPRQLQLQAVLRTREGARAPDGADPERQTSQPSGLDVEATGTSRGLPLQLHLQSSGVLPLAAQAQPGGSTELGAVPVRLDLRVGRSRLQLDGSGTDLPRLGALDGNFELEGPSLAAIGDALGLTLPTTAAFAMQGQVRKSGGAWDADVRSMRIGSSRLRGSFRYDTTPDVPLLSGTLEGSRLALADLGPAFGASGARGGKAVSGSAADSIVATTAAAPRRVLPQREFDIPSLHAMNAEVRLQLDRADLGTAQLESFSPLQGHVSLQNGMLEIRDLVARVAQGDVRGSVSLDARAPVPQWRIDLRAKGIELARFVKTRNPLSAGTTAASVPAAASAPQRGYVSGLLGAALQAKGAGRSTAAMLSSLDGSAHLWVRDGRISQLAVELAGIDIAESLGLLVRGDRSLPMRCAVGQFTVRDGHAVPQLALIDTGDTTLLLAGDVSLADESLALVMTAKPHDMSPLTLRAPVRLEGSFAQPVFRVDKRSIGLRLAGAAALAALAPPAALLALIDLGEDDRHVCTEALGRLSAVGRPRVKR
jgi:uncharacterized protein involved in outer membrane biogenesis